MALMVSAHCVKCYGSGLIRHRSAIGTVYADTCKHCRGIGRRLVKEGSGEHRIASKIGAIGLTPGIRKGHSKYDAADGQRRYGRK